MSYVMGQSLTFRTRAEVLDQLQRQANQVHMPKTALAERYVQEGLEMDQFPGIVFRSGPSGRRPGLAGGPDVWEVVEVLKAESNDLGRAAENLGLRVGLVESAVRFYASHQAEIDAAMVNNRKLMEEAAQAYRREQELLFR
ncbi:MAG TPA: hypothetical protein VMV23_04675 [Candidatus Nanopelagicaceae bacterium]|nr:hypothetical protein [Candidatus Nanopelagicaceae bacterium]